MQSQHDEVVPVAIALPERNLAPVYDLLDAMCSGRLLAICTAICGFVLPISGCR